MANFQPPCRHAWPITNIFSNRKEKNLGWKFRLSVGIWTSGFGVVAQCLLGEILGVAGNKLPIDILSKCER